MQRARVGEYNIPNYYNYYQFISVCIVICKTCTSFRCLCTCPLDVDIYKYMIVINPTHCVKQSAEEK